MGDIGPGWYDDTEDPRLARWWDGQAWTEHTLVIADQLPGVEPPPPASPATRFPVPPPAHRWLDDPAYADDHEELDDEVPALRIGADRTRALAASPWAPERDVDGPWRRLDDDGVDLDGTDGRRRRRTRDASHEGQHRSAAATATASFGDRMRELPTWMRTALPVALVLLMLGAVASASALRSEDGGTGGAVTAGTQPDPARLRRAAELALEAAGVGWFTREGFVASIPPTCDAAADDDPQRVADRIILLGYDDYTIGRLVDGLEVGVEAYCPDAVQGNPTFFDEVLRLTGADPNATTSTAAPATTAPAVTSSTTTTTKPKTTTTRKASPPATSPTTQPPATTAPPTTAPPTTEPPTTEPTVPEPQTPV